MLLLLLAGGVSLRPLLSTTTTVLDVLFSDAPACKEDTVTVRSVVSLQVEEKKVGADVLLLAGGVAVAGADAVSSHELELSTTGAVVAVSSQFVDDVAAGADTVSSLQDVDSLAWLDCVVSSVQVVSTGALAVVLWDWDAGDETVSPEVHLVEAVPLVKTVPLVEAVPLVPLPGVEAEGPVGCETTELVRLPETGGPLVPLAAAVDDECVPVIPSTALVDRPVVKDTWTGAVPVGPALTTVELGSGKGTALDRTDDEPGDPVPVLCGEVKLPVPLLPVGKGTLEFGCGNGTLLVRITGTLPVPRTPELRGPEDPTHEDGAVGPPVTVWFVSGYGAEELWETAGTVETPVPDPAMDEMLVAFGNGNGAEWEPVARLVGAVPPPPVRDAQVLEFDKGNGAETEEAPVGRETVPEDGSGPLGDPVPPMAELKLPVGEGCKLVWETWDGARPVPNPELPVGPPASEELLIGNGGV